MPRLAAGPVAGTAALLTRRRRVQGSRTHGQVRTRGPSLPPRALMSRRRGMTHTSRRPASARGEAAQTPRPEASAASSAHDRTPSTRPQEQVARAQSMSPARERGSGGPCWPSFQGLLQLHEVTATDEPLARQGGPYAECNRLCEATCFTPPPPKRFERFKSISPLVRMGRDIIIFKNRDKYPNAIKRLPPVFLRRSERKKHPRQPPRVSACGRRAVCAVSNCSIAGCHAQGCDCRPGGPCPRWTNRAWKGQ